MLNWLMDKMIKNYITKKVKEIKEIDVRNKLMEYVNEHKDEVIEKAKQAIDKLIKNLVAKIVEGIKDKIRK